MLSFVALTWCLPRLHPEGEESGRRREERGKGKERRVEKGRKPRRSVEGGEVPKNTCLFRLKKKGGPF